MSRYSNATSLRRLGICALMLLLASLWAAYQTLHSRYPMLAVTDLGWPSPAAGLPQAVLFYTWWPRLVLALLCGAALSAAGVLLQQVLRNPLAAPSTLGLASGAQLALLLATLLAPATLQQGTTAVAMTGGCAAMLLVLALTWRRGLAPTLTVLAGLVVNLFFGAVSTALLLFYQEQLSGLLVWGAGSLAQTSWQGVHCLLPRLTLALALGVLLLRPLAVLALDEASARSLGAALPLLRLLALVLAIFLTAIVVATVGVIGFIGLAAPALVRLLGARTLAARFGWATLLGGLMLLTTDLLLQPLNEQLGWFLPTGAMTALLGAPLLLWLIPRLKLTSSTPASSPVETPPSRHRHPGRLLWGLAAGTLVCLLLALMTGYGSAAQGWQSELWSAVYQWRLPRVAAALCAGMLLALAGTLIQRVARNPMASPELLGISGGCAMAVILALQLWPTLSAGGLLLAGALGAGAMLLLLLRLNRRHGLAQDRLLLTGVALTALLEPVQTLALAESDPSTQQMLAWLSGSTYFVSWHVAAPALLLLLLAGLGVRFLWRWLDMLPFGAEMAISLGVPVARARAGLLLLVALLTAVSTLLVGPLSFVGLLAPHLARMLGLSRAREQVYGAMLLGGLLMVAADWLGRQLLFPNEIPAGLVASLLGGSYFIWCLRRL
ncbi:Fe(3+)-hydroxamate ABC transporter permease FhuB [Pseudaeromonas sharmana]|uniref:Fe(3+)-hydroxamate ABC transporter permease FhuB n=1 Tax=Pseudaeromonas sharmana TaxID=328412 RepID=A0ABV8CIR8_9GAMM